ncbi:helix-turn-helix domain-containing protein [Cohnella hongkongensis]|uniref:Helix-turn-helix domain-containing protein n=1 Tax=Cohnella hongkongensis TaxID=178337 RepID=A0ABV9FBP0_9BACL
MLDCYYELREASELALGSSGQQATLATDGPALLLVTEGGGSLQLGDASYHLHYGCLLLLAPGTHAQLRCSDAASLYAYVLQFDVYRLIEQGRDHLLHRRSYEGLPAPGMLTSQCSPRLAELFRLLLEWWQSPDKTSSALKGHRLLLETIERSLGINDQSLPAEEEPIRKAIRHINERYGDDLNRGMLAEMTGYHPHYFSRKFCKETGLSVTDYITAFRMKKAKEQLLTTAGSVREIARHVGYADALYFSRKFKRHTGFYPTEYRRQPKRIAAFQFLGTLLQLGLRPIAGESHMLRYSDQLRDEIRSMPEFEQWNLNKLRSLAPELIVAPGYLRKDLQRQLAEIAPVLTQSTEEASPLDILHTFGRLLGRPREAEQALERLNALAAKARGRLAQWPGREGTTAVYEIAAGRVYVMGRYDRCSFAAYQMLGLNPPHRIQRHLQHSGGCIMLEPNQLEEYAADNMIVSVYEEEGMELTRRLLSSDSWQRLAAVRRNRVYWIPIGQIWYNDGVSLEKQIRLLEDQLLGAR